MVSESIIDGRALQTLPLARSRAQVAHVATRTVATQTESASLPRARALCLLRERRDEDKSAQAPCEQRGTCHDAHRSR